MELLDSFQVLTAQLHIEGGTVAHPEETNLFSGSPGPKSRNDRDNSTREQILGDLFSSAAPTQEVYLSHPKFGSFWATVRKKFDASLKAFQKPPVELVPGAYITKLEKKGGRNSRFDYLAWTNWAADSSGLKLEFKRGTSIFDQPQFLQLYAKSGILVRENLKSYPEFLYENFGERLAAIAGVKIPPITKYLQQVCGTSYSADPFFESLYRISKTSRVAELRKIQYESIDQYLHWISDQEHFADTKAFQAQLTSQLEKLFVSWDTKKQNFVVENFTADDVTLSGKVSFKGGKNGRNTVVFENAAGNNIEALLRWKNNPCVLGPAWQISLKTSSQTTPNKATN